MCWLTSHAQDERLNQLSSRHTWIIDQNKWSAIKGVYEQKGNTLSADSSILIEDENKRQYFDAFRNVVITQPSGTMIYADKLHYDALTQIAVLTNNVRLVSENSVLTTNHLTYNMNLKTGTYTGGGRIISNQDTITSQRAYYFEKTGDTYFRGKVIVRTPSVKVYTDSMNYNQISKDTHFFGPTDIKGNNNENLYTERGVYNTESEVAKFSKNNLYNDGSKFLSGDSIYYSKEVGIGEAYRNVVFVDTLDKFYAYGNKGVYDQAEESILMTEKPYIVTVVKNDSTSTDTTDSTAMPIDSVSLSVEVEKEGVIQEERIVIDSIAVDSIAVDSVNTDSIAKPTIPIDKPNSLVDSVFMTADTLFSKVILAKDYIALDLQLSRDGGQLMVEEDIDYGDENDDLLNDALLIEADSNSLTIDPLLNLDSLGNPIDSIGRQIDSLSRDSTTRQIDDRIRQVDSLSKELTSDSNLIDSIKADIKVDSLSSQVDSLSSKIDSLSTKVDDRIKKEVSDAKNSVVDTVKAHVPKSIKNIKNKEPLSIANALKADSVLRREAEIPLANKKDSIMSNALKIAQSLDSIQTTNDSLRTSMPSDTAKTRIVKAYYNVRLFKSDLQAVADSVYYGMQDSMFRFMGRPMIWSQGSQISADTIFMQIVNQQMDNALLKDNAFMVNVVLDSVKFNQLKGRRITAFFANNNIDRLFVDGNAENLVFATDDKTRTITEMFHDRGGRIKVKMENKEIIDYTTIQKVDQKVYPLGLVNQENEILPGFIWRPQDRPLSKEDLLNRKREGAQEIAPADADNKNTAEKTADDLEILPEVEEEVELVEEEKVSNKVSSEEQQSTEEQEAEKQENSESEVQEKGEAKEKEAELEEEETEAKGEENSKSKEQEKEESEVEETEGEAKEQENSESEEQNNNTSEKNEQEESELD